MKCQQHCVELIGFELGTLETISMKDGFKEAPPTKNPSTLGFVISSWSAESPKLEK